MGELEDKINDAEITSQEVKRIATTVQLGEMKAGNAIIVGVNEVTNKLDPVPQGKKWVDIRITITGREVDESNI